MKEIEKVDTSDFEERYSGVLVHHTVRLDVDDFSAGEGTVINAHAVVSGTKVHLGRECWIDEYAVIGGGSNRDNVAFLQAGNWLHMGQFSQLNIGRGITIGDEVGIGIGTRVFTHGAYLSEWDGFPVTFKGVTIGDRVWLPNALVNPGVTIGNDVVVASGSVVSSDVASGCLVGGSPAKVLKDSAYPRILSQAEREMFMTSVCEEILVLSGLQLSVEQEASAVNCEGTIFDLENHRIEGKATPEAEFVKNQFRRHGIRFKAEILQGVYQPWN